jgi:RNA recognition motif-containing protein
MEQKIVCRKCQGNHLTIKCGKEGPSVIEKTTQIESPREKPTININNKYDNNNRFNNRFNTTKKFHKVKMTNLPIDIFEEELKDLLSDWGDLARLKICNYEESSTAFIEFYKEDQIDYLIKALHKTPFDSRIIDLEKLLE